MRNFPLSNMKGMYRKSVVNRGLRIGTQKCLYSSTCRASSAAGWEGNKSLDQFACQISSSMLSWKFDPIFGAKKNQDQLVVSLKEAVGGEGMNPPKSMDMPSFSLNRIFSQRNKENDIVPFFQARYFSSPSVSGADYSKKSEQKKKIGHLSNRK